MMNPCNACSIRATSFAFLKATNSNASKRSSIFPNVVRMTFVSVLKDSMVACAASSFVSFLFSFRSSSAFDFALAFSPFVFFFCADEKSR